jgi:lipoprotein signal peptidase
MRRLTSRLVLLTALTLLVGCDHATKFAVKSELEGQGPRSLIHGLLDLRYTENTDVAFNLLRAVPERVRAPLLVVMGAAAMIALPHWPVFNVADIYVTAGAFLLAWSVLRARREQGEQNQAA